MYCSTKGYYLSLFSSNLQVQFFYFKTSHVIVYPASSAFASSKVNISKHLMLLFISAIDYSISWNYKISKHLMLLFITVRCGNGTGRPEFQNISCYCLSAVNRDLFHPQSHFKTSHVIVYPLGGFKLKEPLIFQNISCYCLSCRFQDQLYTQTISKHLMLLFIGRAGKSENYIYHISKHLMLLFIEY